MKTKNVRKSNINKSKASKVLPILEAFIKLKENLLSLIKNPGDLDLGPPEYPHQRRDEGVHQLSPRLAD